METQVQILDLPLISKVEIQALTQERTSKTVALVSQLVLIRVLAQVPGQVRETLGILEPVKLPHQPTMKNKLP